MSASCRHDCSCPSQLHHEIEAIISRWNAPIPRPSIASVISDLEEALVHSREEEDDEIQAMIERTRAARYASDWDQALANDAKIEETRYLWDEPKMGEADMQAQAQHFGACD